MLQQDEPDDFVIGTGTDNSVGDLVDIAFAYLGLDPAELRPPGPRASCARPRSTC